MLCLVFFVYVVGVMCLLCNIFFCDYELIFMVYLWEIMGSSDKENWRGVKLSDFEGG